jgi:hypothetical protein
MNARTRKFVGLIGMIAYLAGYIWLVSVIAPFVPDHQAAKLAFYVIAGVAWGVPLFPLIKWMERGR